jgi:hypothetical protein
VSDPRLLSEEQLACCCKSSQDYDKVYAHIAAIAHRFQDELVAERARVARREAALARVGKLLTTEQDVSAALRARVVKLGRVVDVARGTTPPCDYSSDYDPCAPSCAVCRLSPVCAALAALEASDG